MNKRNITRGSIKKGCDVISSPFREPEYCLIVLCLARAYWFSHRREISRTQEEIKIAICQYCAEIDQNKVNLEILDVLAAADWIKKISPEKEGDPVKYEITPQGNELARFLLKNPKIAKLFEF